MLQLFPYHLSDYVCRVLRVTPFKYYCDLLYTVMREEKSYDQIPNFAVSTVCRSPCKDGVKHTMRTTNYQIKNGSTKD